MKHTLLNRLSPMLRIVLGLIFLLAAGLKIWRGQSAGGGTILDGLAPVGSIWWYAFVAGEGMLGVWLLTGRWAKLAVGVVMAGMVVSAGVMGAEMLRANPRACGCAVAVLPDGPGSVRKELGLAIVRNALIAGLGWMVIRGSRVNGLEGLRAGNQPDNQN